MAFTIPVYVAILTGRRITDVISLHERPEEAIAQCQKWMARAPDVQVDCVHPGYLYYAQYGTQDDTVRVEKHQLELQEANDESEDDDDDAPLQLFPGPRLLDLMTGTPQTEEACTDDHSA